MSPGDRAGAGSGGALVAAALTAVTFGGCVLATVLAVTRTLSPESRRAIELVAFTPIGLPAALVALVGAWVVLRRRRRLRQTVLACAAGLAVLHAWWLAPQFVGEVPRADPTSTRLVVMTQNFEEGEADAVADLVRQHDVDVLVLTDTTEERVSEVVASGVGNALPYDTLENGRGSVVWSRYPISSDTYVSDSGDSREVTLDVPGLSQVTLFALHPTPPYQADGSQWEADWEQALTRIRRAYGDAADDGRVLVVGDLNATADHWPVRSLVDMGFRDVAEQLNLGLTTTWPANGTYTRLGITVPALLALDHVLTADGLVPTDQVVTSDVGSDHDAVIATIAGAR